MLKARIGACAAALALVGFTGSTALAASPVTQLNQGNLISALNNINAQISKVSALNNLTLSDVRVVNVQDVVNNNQVLNNALNRNRVNIQILRDFLNNSVNNNNVQILDHALNNNNVTIGQIVALDVLSGGNVIAFTR